VTEETLTFERRRYRQRRDKRVKRRGHAGRAERENEDQGEPKTGPRAKDRKQIMGGWDFAIEKKKREWEARTPKGRRGARPFGQNQIESRGAEGLRNLEGLDFDRPEEEE